MSRFKAFLLEEGDRPDWDALHARSAGHLGLEWDYLAAVSVGTGTPIRIGIRAEDGQLVAGACFVERRHRLVLQWRHPTPAPFAGLLFRVSDDGESFLRDVLGCLASFVAEHVVFAELIFAPPLTDVRGLLWQRGWSARPHFNYTSTITAGSRLAAQAEGNVRRQIKAAEESGANVRRTNGFTKAMKQLLIETQRRKGIARWVDEEAFRALSEAYQESGRILGAEVHNADGSVDAAGLFLSDRERCYYLLGCSRGEGGGGPSLLHAKATDWLLEERGGVVCYDWCGANTPSVAQFKKKFRPKLEHSIRCFFQRGLGKLMV